MLLNILDCIRSALPCNKRRFIWPKMPVVLFSWLREPCSTQTHHFTDCNQAHSLRYHPYEMTPNMYLHQTLSPKPYYQSGYTTASLIPPFGCLQKSPMYSKWNSWSLPTSPTAFPLSMDSNSTFSSAQAKTLLSSFIPPYTTLPTHQQILFVLANKADPDTENLS